jgi:hypothetical protein
MWRQGDILAVTGEEMPLRIEAERVKPQDRSGRSHVLAFYRVRFNFHRSICTRFNDLPRRRRAS